MTQGEAKAWLDGFCAGAVFFSPVIEMGGRREDPEPRFRGVEAGAVIGGGGAITLEPDQADSAFCNECMLSSMQNMGKATAPEGVLRQPRIHANRER